MAPSAENTDEFTGASWPLSVMVHSPLWALQSLAVPSSGAVSTVAPSAEKTADLTH